MRKPRRHAFHIKEFFRKLYHNKVVRFFVYLFLVLAFPFVGFYAHFIEPRLIRVSRIKIPIKKLPAVFASFRIVQISDLHYGPTNLSAPFIKKCVEKINALKPDLVAMTGDFMQWDSKYARPLAKLLSGLKAHSGIFAILGNHDYGVCHKDEAATDPVDHREVINEFAQQGIRVLHNEKTIIQRGKELLHLVGLGDFWTSYFRPEKVLEKKQSNSDNHNEPTILLSHNPDSIMELNDYHFSLMLSGHVHGGQISFPWIGPLAVPVKHRHLRRGLHRIGEKWLYTNRGLGFIFKARLLSPPEITCLELVPA